MWAEVVKIERMGTVWVQVRGADRPVVMIRRRIREHDDLVVCSIVKVEYDRHYGGYVRQKGV